MTLAIVTATLDVARAQACVESWEARGVEVAKLYVVLQRGSAEVVFETPASYIVTQEILGVVPAFALGVQKALEEGADVIACLHDDLLIEEDGWDQKVLDWFRQNPRCGLAGFGGGTGLGAADIYQTPYNPIQLARQDFVSNMRDAEAHGRRATTSADHAWPYQPERVACLDGFSQIGRRKYWEGWFQDGHGRLDSSNPPANWNLFGLLERAGLVHHAYDAALGAFAALLGWEAWMLPIACQHFGGRTAVADPRYHDWANVQRPATEKGSGDQQFWIEAHRIVYDHFRGTLPVRVP